MTDPVEQLGAAKQAQQVVKAAAKTNFGTASSVRTTLQAK